MRNLLQLEKDRNPPWDGSSLFSALRSRGRHKGGPPSNFCLQQRQSCGAAAAAATAEQCTQLLLAFKFQPLVRLCCGGLCGCSVSQRWSCREFCCGSGASVLIWILWWRRTGLCLQGWCSRGTGLLFILHLPLIEYSQRNTREEISPRVVNNEQRGGAGCCAGCCWGNCWCTVFCWCGCCCIICPRGDQLGIFPTKMFQFRRVQVYNRPSQWSVLFSQPLRILWACLLTFFQGSGQTLPEIM